MSAHFHATVDSDSIPPIVLFLSAHPEEYVAVFEARGLWVSTAPDPAEALSAAQELRPDVIIADAWDHSRYDEVLKALKQSDRTAAIPVVLLSRADAGASVRVDVHLRPPVAAETLVHEVCELVERTKHARNASEAARLRSESNPGQRPAAARPRPASADPSTDRACPTCGHTLRWIERGRLGGVEYDYYRWCSHGCGLFCYAAADSKWTRLA